MLEIDKNYSISFSNNIYEKAQLEIYLENLELSKSKYIIKKNFPKYYKKLFNIIDELEELNKEYLIENYDSIIFKNNKVLCKIYFPNNCGTSILCTLNDKIKEKNDCKIITYLPLLAIVGLYFCIYK